MWHYVQNGVACGPVEVSALQLMLQNGSLGSETLVWKSGMPNWVAARSVPELAASIPTSATAKDVPPPIPPLNPPPGIPTTSMDPEKFDIEHNKVFAVMAYIGILFLVPLLAAPRSKFARYHTNQGIVLFLACIILSGAFTVLVAIPLINILMIPMGFALPVTAVVFMVIGIVHAASGEYKPLPLIGHFRLLN